MRRSDVCKGRGRRSERGTAIIELSLLLPILVSLFLGTWFIGFDNYLYAELEQAVRSGARYATHGVYSHTNPTAYSDAVKNAVVFGNPAGGTTPVVQGLDTTMVNVTLLPATGTPTTVTVSVSGFRLWGPYGNSIPLGNKPSLK